MSAFSISQPKSVLRLVSPRALLLVGLLLGLGLLLLTMLTSILFGAADISTNIVLDALLAFDPDNTQHLIIRTLRIPRALVAVMVGASLAVAGAVMQGLTRNPLADPGILGIETGAALGVVAAVFFLQISSLTLYRGDHGAALFVYHRLADPESAHAGRSALLAGRLGGWA